MTAKTLEIGAFKPVLPLTVGSMPLLLGALTAIGPISTDIYLPALPELESNLHASVSGGAWTMTVWVAGLAIGQLVAGPVTDCIGRKIPLLAGALLYALFSFLCAYAHDLGVFCLYRFLAALAASVSLVSPKAIVRDLTEGNATASFLSKLVLVQGLVPILAPALGGVALNFITWRDLFLGMGVYGIASFLAEWIFLPETLLRENKKDFRSLRLVALVREIWADPSFRRYGTIWMLQGVMVFSYLAGAPALFENIFELSPTSYGALFGIVSVGLIATAPLNIFLLKFFKSESILKANVYASFVTSAICLGVLSVTLLYRHELLTRYYWPTLIVNALACFSALFPGSLIGPNAFACALRNQVKHAGSASALGGCGVYLFGCLGSAFVAVFPFGPAIGMCVLFVLTSFLMWGCARFLPSES